ncbi:TetR/AcrR family transcriptional regulator [Amycolatopsis sp. NPDC051102]|uniref:TetR/AcrR family transcriptional regulator n=1 Tax=Amycolatopsis sp. NPDC051102 TaxID=3155163 RepID=UPI0034395D80
MGKAAADPKRADARRNRARLLEAAADLLAAQGVAVSFDEIARRAGVGVGTVYRHFPAREELFRTVVDAGLRQLAEQADALAGAEDAGDAFFRFFYLMVDQTVINKALCEAFDPQGAAELLPDRDADRSFEAALGALLARAKAAGRVRADLDVAEVRMLVVASVMVARSHHGFSWRMVALIAGALRPDDGRSPVPAPDVTKLRVLPAGRHETRPAAEPRNETAEPAGGSRCTVCGTPIETGGTGRPARYCGATCRQRAHRSRAKTG